MKKVVVVSFVSVVICSMIFFFHAAVVNISSKLIATIEP